MGDGPRKKKRPASAPASARPAKAARANAPSAAAAASSAAAAPPAAAGSVAEVLSGGLFGSAPAEASVGSQDEALKSEYTRLFKDQPVPEVRVVRKAKRNLAAERGALGMADAIINKRKHFQGLETVFQDGLGEAKNKKAEKAILSEARKQLPVDEYKEQQSQVLFVGNCPLGMDAPRLRQLLRDVAGDKYTGKLKPIWFRHEPVKAKWKNKVIGIAKKDYDEAASNSKDAYVRVESQEAVKLLAKAITGFPADEDHVLRGDGVGENARLSKLDRRRSVFVGNLMPNVTESQLRKHFKKIGEVDSVRIVRDQHQACRGVAFVCFKDRSCVKPALEMAGTLLDSREIRVTYVTDQSGEAKLRKKFDENWNITPAARRKILSRQRRARTKIKRAQDRIRNQTGKTPKKMNTRTRKGPNGRRLAAKTTQRHRIRTGRTKRK